MRKRLFILTWLLVTGMNNLFAQMVFIPDSNFRKILAYNYPGAIVGDSLNTQNYFVLTKTFAGFSFFQNGFPVNTFGMQYLVGLTDLAIYNPPALPFLPPNLLELDLNGAGSLYSLPSLPSQLEELRCFNTWNLSYLPSLPNSLRKLYTYQTGISNLPIFPDSMEVISIRANVTDTIKNLPSQLVYLDLHGCYIHQIPPLPSKLSYLDLGNNRLKSISFLPNATALNYFDCSENQLTSLPAISPLLKVFKCSENFSLKNLPSLGDSLEILECAHDSISFLIKILPKLEVLDCSYNFIHSLDSFPTTLRVLNCAENPIHSLDKLPQELRELTCFSDSLSMLPQLPPKLAQLTCSFNNLTALPTLPDSLVSLITNFNPITCLPYLPNKLKSLYTSVSCLPNKPSGLTTAASLLLPICNTTNSTCAIYPRIIGRMYADLNSDGVYTVNEPLLAGKVLIQPGNILVGSNIYGLYSVSLNLGISYTVSGMNGSFYSVTSLPQNSLFGSYGQVDTVDIACTTFLNNDLQINISNFTQARPGFNNRIQLCYSNMDSQNHAVRIQLNFSSIAQYSSSTIVPDSIYSNSLIWNFPSVQAYQNACFDVIFSISSTAFLGQTLSYYASIEPFSGDSIPLNNLDSLHIPIVGSCDPNEKAVDPPIGLSDTELINDGFLSYTIRFQNTGTADAINVEIVDTLDLNLDITSFNVETSSHTMQWFLDGRVVHFSYHDIYLPDSNVSEPLSHGFINYRVKPNSSLQVGATINNTANIYFDFNPAVKTNTTHSIIYNPLYNRETLPTDKWTLYPNPTSTGTLYLHSTNLQNEASLVISNIYGKEIYRQFFRMKKDFVVNCESWPQGIYIIELKTNFHTENIKFVKD